MGFLQRTLRSAVRFEGIGLHTGALVEVEIRPACAGTGIVFERSDLPGRPTIKACPENVLDTILATRLGTSDVSLSTVEHTMAALYGMGIDNAYVSVNNIEMPILDGSALPILAMLDEAGIRELAVPKTLLVVNKVLEIVDPRRPDRFIRVEPSRKPRISYAIDFERAPAIGKQIVHLDMNGHTFCEELCFARTFCMEEDVETMRKRGLALGGSMANAIVVSTSRGVLNQQGLRSTTEFVRHKALDCLGDLALTGMPIMGHVIAHKAGHDLHTTLAKLLLESPDVQWVTVPSVREGARLSSLVPFPESLEEFGHVLALSSVSG